MTGKSVDARGLSCPGPVLETRKVLQDTKVTSLEVLVDNEGAAENVARMARTAGCEVRLDDRGEGVIALLLDRPGEEEDGVGEVVAQALVPQDATCPGPTNITVFIGADTIGRGDDKLGRLLMVAFIKTLEELVPRPNTLALMNSGVRLAVKGSELVDTLTRIDSLGIEILVCGTCLDFFDLKDDLKVGRISNMFEISSRLVSADRVVRP